MLRMAARSLRSSAERHDVVVVGGGVMGAWTACMAAKRGASVCLVDQHSPGHTLGSSHGDGRIFRLAYSEDDYVDMMLHSLPLWHELDAFADESLIATTGGLNIAQRGRTARAAAAGEQNELDSLRQLYVRRGIAHELLSSDAVNERFPQFHLAPHLEALYQPDFGVLFASRCVSPRPARCATLPTPRQMPLAAGGTGSGRCDRDVRHATQRIAPPPPAAVARVLEVR